MKPRYATYTVVEQSGHEGEFDRKMGFASAEKAWNWAERHYGRGQIENMHVQVRRDHGDEQTYEY